MKITIENLGLIPKRGFFHPPAKITVDVEDNQLEVIVENGEDDYSKHFVGLSDNVTYVIEDVEGADVENTKYTLNFNPDMWIPVNVKTID